MIMENISMNKKFYITTPIYYASGKLHLGHCSSTVYADAIARFMRQNGADTFFLTGSDEHGQKIERKAQEANLSPKEYVDKMVQGFKELWEKLGISYDKFIRTTDEEHKKCATYIFDKLLEKGFIYKDVYEGLYCTPCESFWTESQLIDGKCPDCHRAVEPAKEESYFFNLSKFEGFLTELLKNDDFVKFSSVRNEMLNNFIKPGLDDLCVSRTSFNWGIPISADPKHVMYVWIDALSNYLSALGAFSENDDLYKKYWPCDVHIVGKDIARFHTIIWPSLLKALDIPLPKRVHPHGWFTIEGQKMGKSLGNAFDINLLIDKYSADSVRHYILKHGPLNGDVPHSPKVFLSSINSDLCNDLGNLVSRTLAMLNQYRDGIVPKWDNLTDIDEEVVSMCQNLVSNMETSFNNQEVIDAYDCVFALIRRMNKYIDQTTPWLLAKDKNNQGRLDTVLAVLIEALRFIGIALQPFVINTSQKILNALQIEEGQRKNVNLAVFSNLLQGKKLSKIEPLFPRLDVEKELKVFEVEDIKKVEIKKEEKMEETESKELITIDDFAKIELKIGTIIESEKVENADKLLKSKVKIGDEVRTIVSGIAKFYNPADIIGKQVVVVTNLKPAKLRGIESQGMILCASYGDKLTFVSPSDIIDDGAEVR